jgi:protein-disulfide isomerase
MAEHREPGGARDCTDPLDELQALGNTLHVTGTPTLFLQNGRRLQGALPAAELQALLEPHAAADTRNKKAAQAQDDAASASRE